MSVSESSTLLSSVLCGSSLITCLPCSLSISVTFSLLCKTPSRYCIEYSNGTLHDVLTFELVVVISAAFAILGYWRAHNLFQAEQGSLGDSDGNIEESIIPLATAAGDQEATQTTIA